MKFFSALRKPAIIKRKNSVATEVTEVSQSDSSRSNSSTASPRIPSTPASLAQSTASSSSGQLNFQELSEDVIMSSVPMMRIISSQLEKKYFEWGRQRDTNVWTCSVNDQEDRLIEKISVIGTIFYLELEDQTKTSFPLIGKFSTDSNAVFNEDSIMFVDPLVSIRCENNQLLNSLQKLIALALFEHFSVYKSLTGSLISSIGLRMPDINMILNSQFNFKDWCDIYIPEEGWVRSWCHINKMSKKTDKYEPKGKYQIKFYRHNKSANPSSNANLICYIPDTSYVQDIFFYNGEETTQTPISNPTSFLSNITTVKLVGDVLYPDETPALRTPSTSSSITKQLISPKRDVSTKAVKSSKSSSFRTKKNGVLIRPLPHHGLSHFDAMIKFIIPMMDVTRKYGRPTQFVATTNEVDSLMFGLPKLPNTNYFKESELETIINDKQMEYLESTETLAYSMSWISELLKEAFEINPDRY
ncbi:similar to Saccharomyces cerevisiae YJL016W Putative protein of unknown function [Maudiozyma barnettii]|uniref:Skg3/CAF120-like PH-like domain-containing protein n=1 Tax=Maudiozyma barnettii TaxID=61262 RepID=A0A8H2VBT6_9SACH|nr:Tph3p [Kazachstania barnettii]CAB4252390.1 similar to Saccharomyces cerevisiae YJL016W Putative protein of unknown function [Kazachstania barnettii]CAD1779125.1 similar to Saccharomyces cerevisiae YJL016W Putative protein of unknown function [Kazachstania barnettii]